MEEPEEPELDDDEAGEEENLEPNGGPSVAGLLLLGVGAAFFFHPPIWAEWMPDWATVLLNWPIAVAMIGGGIGVFSGNGRPGAKYGAYAGACLAALYLINEHLHHLGH